MQQLFKRYLSRNSIRWLGVFLFGALTIAACGPEALSVNPSLPEEVAATGIHTGAPSRQPDPTEAFETVMTVLTHPRCINCHPVADRPRQRDEQIFHILNVTRGEDNHGGPVQTCETCHHEENNPYSLVPGAPHWGLAPKTMGWYGLSHVEIVQRLLDPEMNGGRSYEDLIHHVNNDALVLWAWEPGGDRTPIPVPHDEFVQAMEVWLEAGAPIPGA